MAQYSGVSDSSLFLGCIAADRGAIHEKRSAIAQREGHSVTEGPETAQAYLMRIISAPN